MSAWAEMSERERDAWLAVATGWTTKPHPQQGIYWIDPQGYARDYLPPAYTTDLAAAMGLAEQMREKGWDYGIKYGWYEKSYRAYFREHDSGMERFREGYARAATVAPALAEACYRALGGE